MVIDTQSYIYPNNLYRYFSSNADFLTLFAEWFVESSHYGNPDMAILYDHACAVAGTESAEDNMGEEVEVVVQALSKMMNEFALRNRPLAGQLSEVAVIKLRRGQPGQDGNTPIPETLIVSSMDYMSNGGRYVTIN